MSNKEIDPYVKKILQQHLPPEIDKKDAIWFHKQSGQWIAKHRTLEIIAAKCGIGFEVPQIIESDVGNGICVISVVGVSNEFADGTLRREWSIGEASPANCRNQYPAAMAEKRAKDRVILKLLGLHGYVYSDVEIPIEGQEEYDSLVRDLESCEDLERLEELATSTVWADDVQKLTEINRGLAKQIRKDYKRIKDKLTKE